MKNLLAILFLSTILFAQEYKLNKIISSFGIIWAMDFVSKNEFLFTLKDGRIFSYDFKNKKTKELIYLNNVSMVGQGGLLDLKVSPSYKIDNKIFITYVKKHKKSYITVLASLRYKNKKLSSLKELYLSNSSSDTFRHFGSRITFDKNHIYLSVGDRGIRENAQNLKTDSGSILRFNLDGSFVKDNAFLENKAIYSYGHRNPQGLYYDKKREILFSSEHGPRGGDEINIIKKAGNYGWPLVSFGKEYWNPFYVGKQRENKKGMIDAIKVYTPSIAPASLMVYEGNKFKSWKGNLFLGSLKLTHLNRIVLDKNNKVIKEERLFEDLKERIRALSQNSQGDIFFSTDSGNIYHIKN